MNLNSSPGTSVADLHCDLLAYLWVGAVEKERRSAYDLRSRAAIPQLREGRVALQTLAIFVLPKPGSAEAGELQCQLFEDLLRDASEDVRALLTSADLDDADGRIALIPALEGGSTFAEEDEPLDEALKRLDSFEKRLGRLLYVSLTWNHETRFGGGNASKVGLKDEGRVLLEYLSGRRIAIDLSHASHALAADILDTSYARGLDLPVLASHSPFASLQDIPRNLPDDIAREIIRRDGVIGLNFLTRFLASPPPGGFAEQIAHAFTLGGAKNYGFGADFYYEGDVPEAYRKDDAEPSFSPGYGDSSCYPRLLEELAETLELDDEGLADIAHRNVYRFIRSLLG